MRGFGTAKKRALSLFFFSTLLVPVAGAWPLQSGGYGPEVKSFLEYIRHEQVELNFQIEHNEITRKDFTRSKNRLEVQKQAVLTRVKRTGEDIVPEYTVMAADELGDILPSGLQDLKGHKPGEKVSEKWRYVGVAVVGERFYIMERVADK